MGHVDERDPDLALDRLQLDLHLLAQLQVEGAERLVEQQDAWLVDDRPGEGDALLLATRELSRLAALVAAEPHGRERLRGALPALRLVDALTRSPYATLSPTLMCGKSA